MKLAAFIGRCLIFLASMALITFVSLFVVGAYLVTWPIMRTSPRSARTKALMDIAVAVFALARAYGLDREALAPMGDATPEDEPADT